MWFSNRIVNSQVEDNIYHHCVPSTWPTAATIASSMGTCLTEWKAKSSQHGRALPSPHPLAHSIYFLFAPERIPEFL